MGHGSIVFWALKGCDPDLEENSQNADRERSRARLLVGGQRMRKVHASGVMQNMRRAKTKRREVAAFECERCGRG